LGGHPGHEKGAMPRCEKFNMPSPAALSSETFIRNVHLKLCGDIGLEMT
jgi:hypothetical protein